MSNIKEIPVPDIGDFDEVEVIEVLVNAGDTIAAEDSLISLESDKATMEIPAPEGGVVKELKVAVGDKVAQGAVILLLESSQSTGAAETAPAAAASPAEPATPPAEQPPAASQAAVESPAESDDDIVPYAPDTVAGQQRAHASPSVRRFAFDLGVNLNQVRGSGPKARILKEDVQTFVKQAMQQGASTSATGEAIPAVPKVDFAKFGEVETQPLSRIKKIAGKHLHACWLNIPHVTQFDEADITNLENFRKDQKDYAEKQNIKLTFMPFLMKACAAALKAHPEFNSSLSADGQSLIIKKYVHIGVAVDTPNGLMVPVIRNVDKKGVFQLAEELMEISAKTREGKLAPADMQGGCFSISSLGGIGGTQFTPIVNAPEVAILGVSRAAMKPVWNGKDFDPKLMMPFSLSYDHRAIDGAQGVRFTTYLGQLLGDIRKLLL